MVSFFHSFQAKTLTHHCLVNLFHLHSLIGAEDNEDIDLDFSKGMKKKKKKKTTGTVLEEEKEEKDGILQAIIYFFLFHKFDLLN